MAETLSLWLYEREIDLNMPLPELTRPDKDEPIPFLPFEKPFSTELTSGDILLLSRDISPVDIIRPVYVAYLQDWLDNYVLVAPFSPYSVPATDGELLTSLSEIALRVICPWNSHTVSKEAISKSWIVKRLSIEDLEDAKKVFYNFIQGTDLDERILMNIGPPIFHEKDPRISYEDEQIQLMTGLVQTWEQEIEELDNIIVFPVENKQRMSSLARSGNKRKKLLSPQKSTFICWEKGIELEVEVTVPENKLNFKVHQITKSSQGFEISDLTLHVKQPLELMETFKEGTVSLELTGELILPVYFHLEARSGEKLIFKESENGNVIVPFFTQDLARVADDNKIRGETTQFQSADNSIRVLVQGFPEKEEVMFWIESRILTQEELGLLEIVVPVEEIEVKKIHAGVFSCKITFEKPYLSFILLSSDRKEIKLTRI